MTTWGELIDGLITELGVGENEADYIRAYFAEELPQMDPDKPATATTQLEPHQHVVEITDDPAGDPVLADDGEGQYVVIVRSGGAG